jgi:hypothetical protein
MQSSAYPDAEVAHRLLDVHGALDRAGGAIEGREEPVTNRLYLAALVSTQLAPNHEVVTLDQFAPAAVA